VCIAKRILQGVSPSDIEHKILDDKFVVFINEDGFVTQNLLDINDINGLKMNIVRYSNIKKKYQMSAIVSSQAALVTTTPCLSALKQASLIALSQDKVIKLVVERIGEEPLCFIVFKMYEYCVTTKSLQGSPARNDYTGVAQLLQDLYSLHVL
jgi:hypothetical protein